MVRLDDKHASIHPDDAFAFAKNDFHDARVLVVFFRPLLRTGRRRYRLQTDDSPFGLAHDFLGNDEDRPGPYGVGAKRIEDPLAQVVAGVYFGHPLQSSDADFSTGHSGLSFLRSEAFEAAGRSWFPNPAR